MGHMALAEAALVGFRLDLVLWVPNQYNPLKRAADNVDGEHRLRMIQLMIGSHEQMAVSDVEITREGPSYMYETLEELQAAQPASDFWLILGADNLGSFMTWHYPERILRSARLGVAVRPGIDREALLEAQAETVRRYTDLIDMEPIELSSTAIRDAISRDQLEIPGLHPDVKQYIEEHELYREH